MIVRDRSTTRGFNGSLPCTATLLRATRRGPYADATFRLAARPGVEPSSCNADASTAFRIRSGRITEWRRLPDPPPRGPRLPSGDSNPAV